MRVCNPSQRHRLGGHFLKGVYYFTPPASAGTLYCVTPQSSVALCCPLSSAGEWQHLLDQKLPSSDGIISPKPTLSVRKNLGSETSFSQTPWWNFFYLCWRRKTEFTVEPNFNLSVGLSAGGTPELHQDHQGAQRPDSGHLHTRVHMINHKQLLTYMWTPSQEQTMREPWGPGTRCWVVFLTSL